MQQRENHSVQEIYKSIENVRQQYQAHLKELFEAQAVVYEMVKAFVELQKAIARQIKELVNQFKTAITEGITNFKPPADYKSDEVQLHPWTEKLAILEGVRLLDEIKASAGFCYMQERYEKGLDAHLRGEYQLSIFTFLSIVDGVLKRFCEMHKEVDCSYRHQYPTFNKSLDHFMKHFPETPIVGKKLFEERLDAFFEHRNQIMHGDKHAYFDKNISTISLLFLTLVFPIVESELTPSLH